MDNIKAIIFDWGGVLIKNPVPDLINYCAQALNTSPDLFKTALKKHLKPFQRGEISESKYWALIAQDLQVEPPHYSLWRQVAENIFQDNQAVFNLVQQLRQQGYKTALLSDTEQPMVDYFFDHHYDRYFDVLTFSCLEKTTKPDPKIYLTTLSKLKVRPQETIFIDDKPSNIDAAKQLGINSLLFSTTSDLKRQLNLA